MPHTDGFELCIMQSDLLIYRANELLQQSDARSSDPRGSISVART